MVSGPLVCGTSGPAIAHLRSVDPVMAALIDRIGPDALGPRRRARPSDHWGVLIRAIVAQQVSVASADAIHGRLLAYFGGRAPTPEELLAADPELMRPAAGLSRAKTVSLRSLAAHVVDGSLRLTELAGLDDDEVRRELCGVTGIGPWSADIFLIFHLHRPDVLAVGDVGVRNAMAAVYGVAVNPTPERWRSSQPRGAPTAPSPDCTSGRRSTRRRCGAPGEAASGPDRHPQGTGAGAYHHHGNDRAHVAQARRG